MDKVCCGLCEGEDCELDDSLLCKTCRAVLKHRAIHKGRQKAALRRREVLFLKAANQEKQADA